MNKYFFIIFLIISVVLVGCTSSNNNVFTLPDKKIDEIKITCTEQCQKNQIARFETISFQNEDTFLFKEALENGENLQSLPMYSPEFEVLISFSDSSTMEILLSLGNDKDKEGTFVFESTGGYVIPIQYANNLRDILYE